MKLQCQWNEKMNFVARSANHEIMMDCASPIGSDAAMNPKQLVLSAICGCTGIDVVSLLRKHKQPLEGLTLLAEATQNEEGYPRVFKEVRIRFQFQGLLDPSKVLEVVHLSQTQFCGVSAMISRSAPIHYVVELNGKEIGVGQARFN